MSQPGLVIGSPDAAVSFGQPPTVIAARYRGVRSCPLIGFGVLLFLLSSSYVGVSIWIMNITHNAMFACISFSCGAIFLTQSLFAMYGGNDVVSRQYAIIWAMVLGIVGFIAGGVAVIVNVVALEEYLRECTNCMQEPVVEPTVDSYGFERKWQEFSMPDHRCADDCSFGYDYVERGPVFVGLAVVAALQGLTALISSILACCTACSCCLCYKNYQSQAYVIQSTGIVGQVSTTPTWQVPYQPIVP